MFINVYDILEDIITFNGFKEASIKEKFFWAFVLFPIVFAIVSYLFVRYYISAFVDGIISLFWRNKE